MEYKDIKQTAKEVKQQLKKKYPRCKFSIKIQRYSGGQSMHIALMSAPFEVFSDVDNNVVEMEHLRRSHLTKEEIAKIWNDTVEKNHHQVNQYYINDDYMLSNEAKELFKYVRILSDKDNWDNSDIMTDYFDVNYYMDMSIGKWDKGFIKV